MISQKTRQRSRVALPTGEVEYIAFADAVQEVKFLIKLLNTTSNSNVHEHASIYCDDQGIIRLMKIPVQQG